MTKKLEETFNLKPKDLYENDQDVVSEEDDTQTQQPVIRVPQSLEEMKSQLDEIDKIDQALVPIRNLDKMDSEMDAYATRAYDAFEDLMEIGEGVEERFAGDIFDAATKMMANAINAKQAKMDKKLKAIQLQIQKAKLDYDNRKLDWQITQKENDKTPDGEEVQGTSRLVDRNEMVNDIVKRLRESDQKH